MIYVALGLSHVRHVRLSSHRIYCLSSRGHFVCLVSSFRYNGLATLALAGPSGPRAGPSGPLRALRARRAGPSGPLQEISSHRQEVIYITALCEVTRQGGWCNVISFVSSIRLHTSVHSASPPGLANS